MKRILCIWLPNWPIQRLIVDRPELSGHSLILYALARGVQRVVACSWSAARQGVITGMSLAEATTLIERSQHADLSPAPDFKPKVARRKQSQSSGRAFVFTQEHDPIADRSALQAIAAWCEEFSPGVALEDAPQPDCLLLDITGLDPLFGGEDLLCERALRAFTLRGLSVRLAVADTIGAAWATAHYADLPDQDPFLIVPSAQTLATVQSLSVRALRLPDETLALLGELGIFEIGQIVALPRKALASRLGPQIIQRVDELLGHATEVLATHHAPPEFEAEWLLEYATDRQEMIHFALEELISRVALQLTSQQQGALELSCSLGCQGSPTVAISIGLFRPSASKEHLCGLLRLQLEHLKLSAPVEVVRVQVVRAAPLEVRQQSLFADGDEKICSRQVDLLIDRLSNRLRREAVLRPQLTTDAQPEFAYRYRMLAGIPRSRSRQVQRTKVALLPAPGDRPIWFYQRPVRLRVISLAPHGMPQAFRLDNVHYQLAHTWGPERIETGWWRGGYIRRDYYRVETTSGARFWIFRQLQNRQWFLQGEYG